MEKTSPQPKTKEASLRERRSLEGFYRGAYQEWKDKKTSYNFPDTLDENFIMVDWGRTGIRSIENPEFSVDFLSDYGSIKLDFFVVNMEKKRAIVSASLYTLGPEGKTRGKGKQGLQAVHNILQRISDHFGYEIFDIATPNHYSSHLLTEGEGYKSFDGEAQKEVWLSANMEGNDPFRLMTLLNSALPYDTRIKKYRPGNKPGLTQRQSWELGIISGISYF